MPSSPRRGRAALLLFISPRFAAEQDPRVAYCFSGHVRSFVQPRVHESIHRELVGALSPSAGQRELFFYVALDDEVPPAAHALPDAPAHAGAERLEYSSSDDGLGAAASHARPMFEPAPTSRDAFEATVSRLWRVPQDVAYRAIAYHEPGAGLIPHACPGGLPPEAAFAQARGSRAATLRNRARAATSHSTVTPRARAVVQDAGVLPDGRGARACAWGAVRLGRAGAA